MTQMMLQTFEMNFFNTITPIPTFLEKLLFDKDQYQIGSRILFESVELKVADGRIFNIFDGELTKNPRKDGGNKLKLIVLNKMDKKKWFKITMMMDFSNKFIEELQIKRFEFKVLKMLHFENNILNLAFTWIQIK